MAYVQGKGRSFGGRPTLVPPGSATDREGMGRQWKQPKKNGASAVQVIRKGTISEQREREKKIKKAYKERMTELKEEIRLNKVEKRKKREEREEKKQKNILRSGTKLQRMTNPKTSKEIAKSKQRKLLKVVSDDMLK